MTRNDAEHPKNAESTARALRNVALGLEPDAAREVMEGADLIVRQAKEREALEQVMDAAMALWTEIGHPMLLAAAQELREGRAALAKVAQ